MKGYKGMSSDMTCRGMQYEIGKTYRVDGDIKLCENGLHFCENLLDVFYFYDRVNGNRFFEVEAVGTTVSGDCKCAASELTIIRELSAIEINRYAYDGYDGGCGYGCSSDGEGYGDGQGYRYGDGFANGADHDGDGYGDGWKFGDEGEGYGDGQGYGNRHGYGSDGIQRVAIYKN